MAEPVRALVTRPAAEAAGIARRLTALGIEPVVEPLLLIRPIAGRRVAADGVQAFLVTSANGARALAGACARRDVPVLAVGRASAAAAREAGFAEVESADGDSAALEALAVGRLDPAGGPLVHASGEHVAGDLAGALAAKGFTVRREVLYKAVSATALSAAARDLIQGGRLAMALFFSPRTARTFVALVEAAGLARECAAIRAVCLSPAVADAVSGLAWREVLVAARPDTPALIEAAAGALAAARNPG